MSEQPTNGTSGAADQPAWDETRIEESLTRLHLLHIKAHTLREVIPKMLETLSHKYPSPETLFNAFVKAANDAQSSITDFTGLMQEEQTKAILAQAQKSAQEDPKGIKPWRYKDHPDWFDPNGKS